MVAPRPDAWVANISASLGPKLDRAAMATPPEQALLVIGGIGAALWLVAILLFHLALFPFGIIALPLTFFLAYMFAVAFIDFKAKKRQKGFMPQLELSLRLMSSALRVGLGLRQAMILVTTEMQDPARHEFMRVVGRTNIGISILDALDELAERMPSNEMVMVVRSIRVQAQTGGDLAKVLDNVANTIKSRRVVVRKMKALTAEGVMSGYIIVALPLVVGGFIVLTQGHMGQALIHTKVGWISLAIVAVLEVLAAVTLKQIMRFDV